MAYTPSTGWIWWLIWLTIQLKSRPYRAFASASRTLQAWTIFLSLLISSPRVIWTSEISESPKSWGLSSRISLTLVYKKKFRIGGENDSYRLCFNLPLFTISGFLICTASLLLDLFFTKTISPINKMLIKIFIRLSISFWSFINNIRLSEF